MSELVHLPLLADTTSFLLDSGTELPYTVHSGEVAIMNALPASCVDYQTT